MYGSPYIHSPFGGQDYQFGGSIDQYGGSAFTDFFTKTIPGGFNKAWDFVKKNNVISNAASFIPGVGKIASVGLRQAGLGKKRRKRRTIRKKK